MDEEQPLNQSNLPMYLILGLLVLLIIGGGAIVLNARSKLPSPNPQTPIAQATPTRKPTSQPTQQSGSNEAMPNQSVKTFTIEGSSFQFQPSQIQVKKGDTVKIIFKSTDSLHNLIIDEFNVATKTIPVGQSDQVQFVASKTGTFDYYCSVDSHRDSGMVGKLIVQ